MLTYPEIDPVAIAIGPLKVHWYGLMYLIGFLGSWWLGRWRARKPGSGWQEDEIGDLIFYGAVGVILGGRLGSILFYNFPAFLHDPLMILRVWEGGMSFHGGLIGVLVAMGLYGRKTGRTFFQVTDYIAPFVPIGLGAGRIGNFINSELWGAQTSLPWGMRVPCYQHPEFCADAYQSWSPPHHPSQLYEFALEGVVLFVLLMWFSSKPRPVMAVSGLFLILYSVFRVLVEFVRLPDAHIQYLAFDWLTMGQLLSLPMFLFGAWFLISAYRNERS